MFYYIFIVKCSAWLLLRFRRHILIPVYTQHDPAQYIRNNHPATSLCNKRTVYRPDQYKAEIRQHIPGCLPSKRYAAPDTHQTAQLIFLSERHGCQLKHQDNNHTDDAGCYQYAETGHDIGKRKA